MRRFFLPIVVLAVLAPRMLTAQMTILPQKGHNGWLRSIALSPDGKWLLTGSNDQTIIMWDIYSGKQLKVFSAHSDEVQSLKFFPDSKTFLSGSANGELLVWDIRKDTPINGARTNGPVTSIDISADGSDVAICTLHGLVAHTRVAAFNKPLQLVLDSYAHTFVSLPGNSSLLFLKNDTVIIQKDNQLISRFPISQLSDIKTVKPAFTTLKDLKKGSQAQQEKDMRAMEANIIPMFQKAGGVIVPNNTYRRPYLMTHDKKTLIEVVPVAQNKIVLWDVAAKIKALEIPTRLSEINQLATSRNDSLLAASNEYGEVFLYDLQHRKAIGYFLAAKDSTIGLGLAFNRTASKLFVAVKEKVGEISLEDKQVKTVIMGFADSIVAVKLSDDGKTILIQQNEQVKTFGIHALPSKAQFITSDVKYRADFFPVVHNYYDFQSLLQNDPIRESLAPMGFSSMASRTSIKTEKEVFECKGNELWRKFTGTAEPEKLDLGYPITELFFFRKRTLVAAYTGHSLLLVSTTPKMVLLDSINDLSSLSSLDVSADGKYLVYTGTDRSAGIIDLRSKERVAEFNIKHGNKIRRAWGHGVSIPNMMRCHPTRNFCVFTTWSGDMLITDLKKQEAVNGNRNHNDLITFMEFSDDGNHLLTYSIDNTLRLWNVGYDNDSAAALGLVATYYFLDGHIVTVLPNNYYTGPKEAVKHMGFIQNGSPYSFEQFDARFNRPDKVFEALAGSDTGLIKYYARAYYKRLEKLKIDSSLFTADLSAPQADFTNRDDIEFEQKTKTLLLTISAADTIAPLNNLNLWINEVPLFGARGKSLQGHRIDTALTVELTEGLNIIETSVTNTNGIESYRVPLRVNYTPAKSSARPKFHIVGLGIEKFRDSTNNLSWSVSDIRNLVVNFKGKYGAAIEVDTLFNEAISPEAVQALKSRLLKTTVDDKVVLVYSGHGLLSKDHDYYLSTYQTNFKKPGEGGLPYEMLEDLLDSIPARRKLMLIDACHSGEVDKEELGHYQQVKSRLQGVKGTILQNTDSAQLGMRNSFELMQELFVNVRRSTGATIIAAAAGTQFALERNALQGGVFTFSILEYMKTHASCTVSELKSYVNKRVSELTEGLQQPTARAEILNSDWQLW